jgi:hypothetical protein
MLLTALLASSLLLSGPGPTKTLEPSEVFEQLKTLSGEWQGKTEAGRLFKVSFRLVANKTVLVEDWQLAPGRESLTLYHMDGKNLIATHYCPLGNQPRLQLRAPSSAASFVFTFLSATNLPSPDAAHQDEFDIQLLGADAFSRSETYLENGKGAPEKATFARVK